MRTVVALYDRFEDAQRAVQALHDAGFERGDINMVARDASGEYSRYLQGEHDEMNTTSVADGAAAGAGAGAVLGGLGGILLGLGALAIPGIGPVIAAGPIVAGLAGAGVGAVAGGLLGALVDLGIPEQHAQYFAEGVRRGGTLVTLRSGDDRADEARNLLNRFNPVDIENRATAWQQKNWKNFDQNAAPMTADEMEFNRSTHMPVTGGMDVDRDMDRNVNADFNRSMDQNANRDMSQDVGRNYTGDRDRDEYRGTDSTDSMRDQGTSFDQDINRHAGEGWTSSDVPIVGQETSQPSNQNWTHNDIPITGGESIFDRDDDVESNMPRKSDTGMNDHLNEDIYSTERAHDDLIDIPVTGGETMERDDIDVSPTDMQDWDRYDLVFRSDYQSRYGTSGYGYDYYQPAYRYGYDLARDPRYTGYDWDQVEMDARRDYQRHGLSGAWEDVKDTVRHAWESVTRG